MGDFHHTVIFDETTTTQKAVRYSSVLLAKDIQSVF